MAKFPIIRVTKSGKRYFILHGKKIYIKSTLTKQEIASIYKLLSKNIKPRRAKTSPIININIPRRTRKTKTGKPLIVDRSNKVTVVSGKNKDTGEADLLNSLINKASHLINQVDKSKLNRPSDRAESKDLSKPDPSDSKTGPSKPGPSDKVELKTTGPGLPPGLIDPGLDLSKKGRIALLLKSPIFQQLKLDKVPLDDPRYKQLAIQFDLEDVNEKKLVKLRRQVEERTKKFAKTFNPRTEFESKILLRTFHGPGPKN